MSPYQVIFIANVAIDIFNPYVGHLYILHAQAQIIYFVGLQNDNGICKLIHSFDDTSLQISSKFTALYNPASKPKIYPCAQRARRVTNIKKEIYSPTLAKATLVLRNNGRHGMVEALLMT